MLISSIQCPTALQVFDSIFSSVAGKTKCLLTQLFGEESEIEMRDCPK